MRLAHPESRRAASSTSVTDARRVAVADRKPSDADAGGLGVLHQGRVAPALELVILHQQHQQVGPQLVQARKVRPRVAAIDEPRVPDRFAPLTGQDGQPQPPRQAVAEQRRVDPIDVDRRIEFRFGHGAMLPATPRRVSADEPPTSHPGRAPGGRVTGARRGRPQPVRPPREPRFPWLRRGTTLVTGVGLVLIAIGLASVVSDLPTEADPDAGGRSAAHHLWPGARSGHLPGDRCHEPIRARRPVRLLGEPTGPSGRAERVRRDCPRSRPAPRSSCSRRAAQRLLPEPVSFGYETTTSDLIAAVRLWAVHDEDLPRPSTASVYAQGRFEVVEPALPR